MFDQLAKRFLGSNFGLDMLRAADIGVARGGAQGARALPDWNTTNDKKLWQHSLTMFSCSYGRRGSPEPLTNNQGAPNKQPGALNQNPGGPGAPSQQSGGSGAPN